MIAEPTTAPSAQSRRWVPALEVRDARHLTNIAAALRACPPIETVERARG